MYKIVNRNTINYSILKGIILLVNVVKDDRSKIVSINDDVHHNLGLTTIKTSYKEFGYQKNRKKEK